MRSGGKLPRRRFLRVSGGKIEFGVGLLMASFLQARAGHAAELEATIDPSRPDILLSDESLKALQPQIDAVETLTPEQLKAFLDAATLAQLGLDRKVFHDLIDGDLKGAIRQLESAFRGKLKQAAAQNKDIKVADAGAHSASADADHRGSDREGGHDSDLVGGASLLWLIGGIAAIGVAGAALAGGKGDGGGKTPPPTPNAAPVAANDAVTTAEDAAVIFDVRTNDTDANGDALSVTQINGTALSTTTPVTITGGRISLGADGKLTFAPAANFNGTPSFTYTVSDGKGGTATATANLTVTAVNDAPVAASDTATTAEDTAVTFDVRTNDSDLEGNALTVTQINGTAISTTSPVTITEGSISLGADGKLTFTPAANFNGTPSFTYTISDGKGGTATATANLTVTAVNDGPVAANDAATTLEDTAVTFDVRTNDGDVDGDALSVTQINGTAITTTTPVAITGGSISLGADGKLTFTPAANFNGTPSFTYTVSDGKGGTATATANLTVTAVNDAPVTVNDTVTTAEDTAVTFDVRANDTYTEGNALAVTQVNGTAITTTTPVAVTGGSISLGADGKLTFTPAANFNGTPSFTYTVFDGNGGTATGTTNLTVTAVNDAPVNAVPASVALLQDASVQVSGLAVADVDAGSGTITTTLAVQNGSLAAAVVAGGAAIDGSGTATVTLTGTLGQINATLGAITYSGTAGFFGSSSLTVTTNDGQATDSDVVAISIARVFGGIVQDGYVAGATVFIDANGNGTLDSDEPSAFTDAAGNFSIASSKSGNIVAFGGTNIDTGLPNNVTLTAPTGSTVINPITTMVTAAVAQGQTTEEATTSVNLALGLPAGTDLTNFDVLSPSADPATALAAQKVSVQIVAVLQSAGAASGGGDTSAAQASIMTQLGELAVAGTTIDLGNVQTITTLLTAVPNVEQAAVQQAAQQTAAVNQTVSAATSLEEIAVTQLEVSKPSYNYAPATGTDLVSGLEEVAVTFDVRSNDVDPEGNPLSVTHINGIAITTTAPVAVLGGVVSIAANGQLTFTPNVDFNGAPSFAYTVSDGANSSAGLVKLTISDVNDGPIAQSDTVSTVEDTAVTFDARTNDGDADGDTLTVTQINGTPISTGSAVNVAGGVVSLEADGRLTFTPASNYNGSSAFAYTATDGRGSTTISTINVTVAALQDAPAATNDIVITAEDTSVLFDVRANDTDADGNSLSVTHIDGTAISIAAPVTLAGVGVISLGIDGKLSFAPASNFNGTPSFTYTVSDGQGGTTNGIVNLTVTPVQDLPQQVGASVVGSVDDDNINLAGYPGAANATGAQGSDVLTGNGDANRLDGGTGADVMTGGLGNDTYVVDNIGDVVTENAGAGIDTVESSISYALGANVENLVLAGTSSVNGSGNDLANRITGNKADNAVNAGDGNDIIFGSTGTDAVDGGAGFDRLQVNVWNGNLFNAATGARTYVIAANQITDSSGALNTAFSNVERVGLSTFGTGDFNDTVDASASIATGGVVIDVGGGNDTIVGSAFSDTIYAGFGMNIINAGAGVDSVEVSLTAAATVFVTSVNGVVTTTQNGAVSNSISNAEIIYLGGFGASGQRMYEGQTGILVDASGFTPTAGVQLYLFDSAGNDILIGSRGNDLIGAISGLSGGMDILTGSGGADIFDYTYALGGFNGDAITDLDGNDTIDLRFNGPQFGGDGLLASKFIGNAAFSGTAGEYRYEITGGQTRILIDSDGDGIGEKTLNIQNGAFAMVETAPGSNILKIESGTFNGTGNADEIVGGAGNDYIDGGAGADRMVGGAGNDTYMVGSNGDVVVEAAGEGTDEIRTSLGNYNLSNSANVENLTGTSSTAQNLFGNSLDNVIQGGAGNDFLAGNAGNDVLRGGSGNDSFAGGGGNDTIEGGVGDDYMVGDEGNDSLDGGAGNDIAAFRLAAGTAGTLRVVQGTGADEGKLIVELVNGGNVEQVFRVTLSGAGAIVQGLGSAAQVGTDTVANFETLQFYVAGFTNPNQLVEIRPVSTGTAGNDTMNGANGTDLIYAGAGNDVVSGNNGDDFIYGQDGNDDLRGNAGNDTLLGGNGQDSLRGGGDNDTLRGDAGDDFLVGGAGDDVLEGGAGIDRISLFDGSGTFGITADLRLEGVAQNFGPLGNDTLYGIEHLTATYGNDTIYGNEAGNWLWTFSGTDNLYGLGGNDYFTVGQGVKTIDGGTGSDTVEIDDQDFLPVYGANGITVSLALQGQAQATGVGNWTLTSIENLSGNFGADKLTGDDNANILAGAGGDDTLIGGGGNDTLLGDGAMVIGSNPASPGAYAFEDDISHFDGVVAGNDYLDGGAGNDRMVGGAGDDTYVVDSLGDQVIESVGQGSDTIRTGLDFGLNGFANIENLTGTSTGNQFLGGNQLDNVLTGGSGDNYIVGGAGDDVIDGGAGNDVASFQLPAGTLGSYRLVDGTGENAGKLIVERVDGAAVEAVFVITVTGTGSATVQGINSAAFLGTDTVSNIEQLHFLPEGPFNQDTFLAINLAPQQFGEWVSGGVAADLVNLNDFPGANNVDGGLGDDTLIGNAGNNVFVGRAGNDNIDGGGGQNDVAAYDIPAGTTGLLRVVEGTGADAGKLIVELVDGAAAEAVFKVTLTSIGGAIVEGVGQAAHLGTDTVANIDQLHLMIAGTQDFQNQFVAINLNQQQFGSVVGGSEYGEFINLNDYAGAEDAYAGRGDDTVHGNSLDNQIGGGSGNDYIFANLGNDEIWGDAGNDYIGGQEGDDRIDGGQGNDIASFVLPEGTLGSYRLVEGIGESAGQLFVERVVDGQAVETVFIVTVNGPGNATVQGVGSAAHLGTDTVYNTEQLHILPQGEFNQDTFLAINLAPQQYGEWVNGGVASEVINLANFPGANNAQGGLGNDTLIGNAQNNNLDGGAGNDSLNGGDGDDYLDGRAGNDFINGGAGLNDIVAFRLPAGTSGTMRVVPGTGPDAGKFIVELVNGSTAAQVFQISFTPQGTVVQGVGAAAHLGTDTVVNYDHLHFYVDNQVFDPTQFVEFNAPRVGTAGNDILSGNGGTDIIVGGAGNDSIQGAGGTDFINGQDGDDYNVRGGGGNDFVSGGAGHDFVAGDAGNDVVRGDGGDDYVIGGIGDDTIDGGAGYDRTGYYHVNSALGGVTVSLALQGQAQSTIFGNDTLVNIEAVSGTPFADTLIGDDAGNWLWGASSLYDPTGANQVANNIQSALNNDTISGGGGDDLIQVGAGNHILDGGTGSDWLAFNENGQETAGATISLALQGQAQNTGVGTWSISGFENVDGSKLDDHITGDDVANILGGGAGSDTLIGAGGDDTLLGDGGADLDTNGYAGPVSQIDNFGAGHVGNDYLDGGAGDDLMIGGRGNDTIIGGDGIDVAEFILPSDTAGTYRIVEGSGQYTGSLVVELVNGDVSEAVFVVSKSEGVTTVQGVGSAAFMGTDTVTGTEGLRFGTDGDDSTATYIATFDDAQAALILEDGFSFADGDLVTVDAAGTHLNTSLKGLQSLNVDAVSVGALTAIDIDAGEGGLGGLSASSLPQFDILQSNDALDVTLNLEAGALDPTLDLAALAAGLAAAGVDQLGVIDDGSLIMSGEQAGDLIDAGLIMVDAADITVTTDAADIAEFDAEDAARIAAFGIDHIDLTDDAATITDEQASLFLNAGIDFAASDAITVEAAGTHLNTSLKGLQSLNVDAVSVGALGAIDIDAGAGGLGGLSASDLPQFDVAQTDAALDATLNVEAGSLAASFDLAALASGLGAAGIDHINVAGDGSFQLSDVQAAALAGADIDFADAANVTIAMDDIQSIDVAVAAAVRADHIDMTGDVANISDAEAALLVDAGIDFAAGDLVTLDAAGTHMSTSLKGLQSLGVDVVDAAQGITFITLDAGDLSGVSATGLPQFDSAQDDTDLLVTLRVDVAALDDLERLGSALRDAGIDKFAMDELVTDQAILDRMAAISEASGIQFINGAGDNSASVMGFAAGAADDEGISVQQIYKELLATFEDNDAAQPGDTEIADGTASALMESGMLRAFLSDNLILDASGSGDRLLTSLKEIAQLGFDEVRLPDSQETVYVSFGEDAAAAADIQELFSNLDLYSAPAASLFPDAAHVALVVDAATAQALAAIDGAFEKLAAMGFDELDVLQDGANASAVTSDAMDVKLIGQDDHLYDYLHHH